MASFSTPPGGHPPEGVHLAPLKRVVVLSWEAALGAEHREVVATELARSEPAGWVWVDQCIPAWVKQARLEGERAFERALLVWLSFAGVTKSDTLVLIEPADDPPLLFATVSALHVTTGRIPYVVTRWQTVRGSLGRQPMPPRLRRVGASSGAFAGIGDPTTQGMVAWMLQAAEQTDAPDEAVLRHEGLLRVVVPAVSALLGRCLSHDLLDVLDPPEHLLALEAALPARHIERRALSEWLRPSAKADLDAAPVKLRPFLERDVTALARLLRAAGQAPS